MRKKDEGSYSLDEPRRSPNAAHLYAKANSREFFAWLGRNAPKTVYIENLSTETSAHYLCWYVIL